MDKKLSSKNKHLKNPKKIGKNTAKSGNFVSPEKWELCIVSKLIQLVTFSLEVV